MRLALPVIARAAAALAPTSALVSARAPAPARAQRVAVDARFGVTPTFFQNELYGGPMVGVAVTLPVAPRLGVRADASVAAVGSLLEFRTDTYTLGLEAQLAGTRGRIPLGLRGALGAGATRVRIDPAHVDIRLRLSAAPADGRPRRQLAPAPHRSGGHVATWHPTFTGGLRGTADLARRVGLFVDVAAAFTPAGGGDRQTSGPVIDGGTFVQLPLTAGVRVRF